MISMVLQIPNVFWTSKAHLGIFIGSQVQRAIYYQLHIIAIIYKVNTIPKCPSMVSQAFIDILTAYVL